MPGVVVVLMGPSGVGKSTLREAYLRRNPHDRFSVSVTDRPPRAGEVPDKDYRFVDPEEFDDLVELGALAEWSYYSGHRYGTFQHITEAFLEEDRSVIAELDRAGARSFKEHWNEQCVIALMLPPSWEELERRLRERGTDDEATINRRLTTAPNEVADGLAIADFIFPSESTETSVGILINMLRRQRALLSGTLEPGAALMAEYWQRRGIAQLAQLLKQSGLFDSQN